MYSRFRLFQKYVRYYLKASNSKGHGIHSPFVFDFIKNVLNDKRNFYAYQHVEDLRDQLLNDKTKIRIEDLGAGSTQSKTDTRTVSEIVKYSSKSQKFGKLLFRMVNYYQPKTIIELGTSLGLSSAYLASALPRSKVITIEGSITISQIARKNFSSMNLLNIESIAGHFDAMLPEVLTNNPVIDFVFVDGNHRKQATLDYANLLIGHISDFSVFVFDDIHWSKEMEDAWLEIKNDQRVMLTVDLFFIGIAFFKNDFKIKQHFVIRY